MRRADPAGHDDSNRDHRDHASGARAASATARIAAQARFEAISLLRHGEQFLVSMVLPALALVALVVSDVPDLGEGQRIDLATAGVLGLGIISTAFTGQAIMLGYERRCGVLRMLGTTPLGRTGLLIGKTGAVLLVAGSQFVVLGVLAFVLGWRPPWLGLIPAIVVVLFGIAAFVSWALVLGGSLRAEGVLALANLIWVLLLAGGGVIIPAERLPDPVGAVVTWLPSAALGDGLRAALGDAEWNLPALLLLAGWAALGAALATRLLRWSD